MAVHCPVCGWTFSSEEAMRKHMASHREAEEAASQQPEAHAPRTQAHAAPGWYPNPSGVGERYWDGAEWTWTRYSEPKPSVSTARLVLCYVAAVLFPIGGLVAGIFLLVRRSTTHGVPVVLISIGVAAAGVLLIPGNESSNGGGDRSLNEVIDQNRERAQKCKPESRQTAQIRHISRAPRAAARPSFGRCSPPPAPSP